MASSWRFRPISQGEIVMGLVVVGPESDDLAEPRDGQLQLLLMIRRNTALIVGQGPGPLPPLRNWEGPERRFPIDAMLVGGVRSPSPMRTVPSASEAGSVGAPSSRPHSPACCPCD